MNMNPLSLFFEENQFSWDILPTIHEDETPPKRQPSLEKWENDTSLDDKPPRLPQRGSIDADEDRLIEDKNHMLRSRTSSREDILKDAAVDSDDDTTSTAEMEPPCTSEVTSSFFKYNQTKKTEKLVSKETDDIATMSTCDFLESTDLQDILTCT